MVNPLAVYSIPDWTWDFIIALVTFVLLLVLIRIIDMLHQRGSIPLHVSQKVFYIFAGPTFLICCLFFASTYLSRYMAAAVPTLFLLLFITTTLGYAQNEGFVRTLSREGDSVGLLKGPLLYILFMIFAALYLWYVPLDIMGTPQFDMFIPTAFLIMGPLAGGNGFANLIGRRYGRHKFNVVTEKSLEGSLIMFLFSLLFTFILLGIYWLILGHIFESFSIFTLITPIFVVSSVTTIVEALSPRHTDYFLIPLCALITILILSWVGLYPYFVMFPLRNPFLP
ncbi:MAG: hypothetical protein Q6364_11350 [Candidatus Hermodarchaeota archaeon]|nr:hypothetical protein [Candidatus Hermodarchaeota archaeon]